MNLETFPFLWWRLPYLQQHRPSESVPHIGERTIEDNGLLNEWCGRVWCNPPYGKETAHWLSKCVTHRRATALVFVRTDTAMFHDIVFRHAHGILFLRRRVCFDTPNGPSHSNPGAASCLIAFDREESIALRASGLPGRFVIL